MERHKLIYCKAFLERARARANASLDTFVRHIEEVEPNFRRCYSETLELSKEELVKDDAFLLKPWLSTNIRLDLLLLENQLPFFVLDSLFNLSIGSAHGSDRNKIHSFLEFTFDYFSYYNRSNLVSDNITIKHFTDLIRTFHLQHPLERRPRRIDEPVTHLQSATELLEAGVRFKLNTKSDCLLDLRLSGRVLEIPQLKVEDWTEILFRNMVALEQCHYPQESYITDYVAVWDFLINTSRDVDLLVRKRVLVNWLGESDSVANLF
ncbi:hypothetical protein SESBI_17740 [Sesbania bispinosa]|nr:hypothetical protein SESBI_17740 [Sesbania bispinosa]